MSTNLYPTDGRYFAAPYAFDAPGVGPVYTDDSQPLYGVFAYDDGPDETPYCYASDNRVQCDRYARQFNRLTAEGRPPRYLAPILRYF
jgi:hypothetical protein